MFWFGNNVFTSSAIFSTPGPLKTKSQKSSQYYAITTDKLPIVTAKTNITKGRIINSAESREINVPTGTILLYFQKKEGQEF